MISFREAETACAPLLAGKAQQDSTALVCQVTRGGQSEALGLRVGDEVLDMNECAYSPTSATNHCRACWCGCACVCVCVIRKGGALDVVALVRSFVGAVD